MRDLVDTGLLQWGDDNHGTMVILYHDPAVIEALPFAEASPKMTLKVDIGPDCSPNSGTFADFIGGLPPELTNRGLKILTIGSECLVNFIIEQVIKDPFHN